MNPDKLFSLLSPKQVLSQESQQAYQSKVDTAKAENKMIKEKVVNPFFSFADKSFKKIMEVLNPGESYVAPALKKIGVNPILAGGIGLGVDILAPGPGELGRVAKVGKEAKVGSELIQEAKKYKSAEEFVKAQQTKPFTLKLDDIKSSWDVDTFAKNRDIPIENNIGLLSEYKSKIKKIEKSPAGREIKTPIKVSLNVNGANGYRIWDGNHRYLQALKNGDKEIKAVFTDKTEFAKSQLTDIFNKAHSNVNPLLSEAKKYKSAEEFVKAQGKDSVIAYHGTNAKFDVFDKSKIGEATGVGDWGDGFYFSDNKDVAKSFAKDAGGDTIMEVNLKNLKFADGNKLEKLPEVQDILDDGMGFTDIGEYLKSKGYDGVKYKHKGGGGTEYVVYDADKIKTKSQLIDIFNKAHGK